MATIEQIISILNNSKQVNELPPIPEIQVGDLLSIWSSSNDRLEYYPAANLTNKSFSFSINAISQSIGTSVAIGKIDMEYSGSAVTKILFDSVFTQYLEGYAALSADYTFILQLYNSTKLKTHIAEITSIAYSDFTNIYAIAELANTINPTSLSVNDIVQVQISVSKRKDERFLVEGNEFTYRPIIGNDGSSFQEGDLIFNGWRSQNVFWKVAEYVSGDGAFFAAWNPREII